MKIIKPLKKTISHYLTISLSNNAFTLLELLVVIAIIGSLAALAVPNLMAARERARDAQRKSDLHQMQKALELYRQDQTDSTYPPTVAHNAFPYHVGSQWCLDPPTCSTIYMNSVPGDPNNADPNYHYTADSTQTSYSLYACLENKADSDPNSSDTSASVCPICFNASYTKCYIVKQI